MLNWGGKVGQGGTFCLTSNTAISEQGGEEGDTHLAKRFIPLLCTTVWVAVSSLPHGHRAWAYAAHQAR